MRTTLTFFYQRFVFLVGAFPNSSSWYRGRLTPPKTILSEDDLCFLYTIHTENYLWLGTSYINEVTDFEMKKNLGKWKKKREALSEKKIVGTTRPDTRGAMCFWDLYVVTWKGCPHLPHIFSFRIFSIFLQFQQPRFESPMQFYNWFRSNESTGNATHGLTVNYRPTLGV